MRLIFGLWEIVGFVRELSINYDGFYGENYYCSIECNFKMFVSFPASPKRPKWKFPLQVVQLLNNFELPCILSDNKIEIFLWGTFQDNAPCLVQPELVAGPQFNIFPIIWGIFRGKLRKNGQNTDNSCNFQSSLDCTKNFLGHRWASSETIPKFYLKF